jgi:hypothetical protein
MSGFPSASAPQRHDRGLASAGRRDLATQTATAWDDFLSVAASVDLDTPTRRRGSLGRAIVAKVGDWPESHQLTQILTDAQAGNLADVDQDAIDDRVIAAHANDDPAQLLAAVARARDSVTSWESDNLPWHPSFDEISMLEVGSPLGPLPVVTYAHAAAFQLAIGARDLQTNNNPIPTRLAFAGLRALVDTTGAIAARMGIDASLSVVTSAGSVYARSAEQGWTAGNLDSDDARALPGIEGEIGTVLDVAAGRQNPLGPFGKPKIAIRDLSHLLLLAPITQDVPGLPGGAVLRKAAGVLSAVNLRSKLSRNRAG